MASELRRLREAAGLTREQVSAETGINLATLYRHETATASSRPQRCTMIALLNTYGVSEQQRADLLHHAPTTWEVRRRRRRRP
nr:helix-turn-helix transcriptional regulator [Frankia sp. CiP3]